jgi:hypothetical protein
MKLRALLAASLILLLSGCATIPLSGKIGYGPDVASGLNNDEVYYSQTGPYDGATQEAILYGFLNSGNGPQNDYAVAREYLTSMFATQWQPNQEVLIQDGAPELFKVNEQEYRVTVGVSAQIDADGRYTSLPAGTKRTSTIQFVQSAGEWRIDSAPNQTILSQPNFKVIFRSYSLYFFEPSLNYLVPDVRWFPSRASTGTRLMNALLKGPSEWLKPAVVNVIPVGTKLNINSVTVENGVAQVDLSSLALRVPESKRSKLKAQITATLKQLPDVTNVEISIQRTPQLIDQYDDGLPPRIGTSPIVLTDSSLLRIGTGSPQAIAGTSNLIASLQPTDFAYSKLANRLALVSSAGVSILDLGSFNKSRVIDARSKQLAPSFDLRGDLWTLNAVEGARFMITGEDRTFLANPWVTGIPQSFAISPEGSRVAVVYLIDETKVTYVFPLERNKLGKPVYLGKPLQITSAPTNSDKVTWADSVTLALLSPTNPVGYIPILITLGGQLRASTAVENATSLTVNGIGQLFVLQPNGNVLESRGSSWLNVAQGALALHVSQD